MGAPKGRIPWNKGKTMEDDDRIKSSRKREPIDKEWLENQYINQKRNTNQIAKELGCSSGFVYSYLKKYDIKIRSKSEVLKGIPKSELHKQKLSIIASNRIVSDITRAKHRKYKPTEETKQKISENGTGRIVPDATRQKISISKIGHEVSNDVKLKASINNSNNNHVKFGLVIEKLLCNYFKNTVKMPYGNKGFDFYCSNMYKVDGKGSFKHSNNCWVFYINKNIIADYFACIACLTNELDSIIPIHFWLIPGNMVNDRESIVIRDVEKSLLKWKQYEQPINKIVDCCKEMKQIF